MPSEARSTSRLFDELIMLCKQTVSLLARPSDFVYDDDSHPLGYLLSSLSIIWCTYSASGIFVTILRMDHQRFLVAYPVGLLYGVFALLSVFGVKK